MPPSRGYILLGTTCFGLSSGVELIRAEVLCLFGVDTLRGAAPLAGTLADLAGAKEAAEG